MDDQGNGPRENEPQPVPLAQWEATPAHAASSRVAQALLLGAWHGDGVPSANGMRVGGLAWGLLLAAVCLVVYLLQPADAVWGAIVRDTPVGKSLLLLVVLVGFLVGNVTLQARQRRNLSPSVSRTVLLALLIGGIVAQWSWRASPVWVAALILTPLLAAIWAYVAASLIEQGRNPILVIGGTWLGLAMILTAVTMLLPPQAGAMVVMSVNPQGPLAGIARALPGQGLAALPQLIDDLGSSDWKVAREAANAIVKLNDPASIEPLREVALDRQVGNQRMFALYALGRIDDPRARQVLAELSRTEFGMAYRETREAATEAAKQKMAQALSDLQSPDASKRKEAMGVLELAATKAHLPVLLGALRDPDAEIRTGACRTLERLEDPRALEGLVVAARDSDRSVRNCAVGALAELGDPRAIPVLYEAAVSGKEDDRQWQAFRGLSRLPDQRSARAMIRWMVREENAKPNWGREALVRMKSCARVPLIEAATSSDYKTRRNAIPLLGELYPGDAQVKAAIKRGEAIFDAQTLTVQFKERYGPAVKADLLLRAAKSSDPAVQAVARDFTDDVSGDANEEILMKARKDPDPRVRAMAIRTLGERYSGSDAEKAVQEALKDKSPLVRRVAIEKAEHTFGQGVVDIVVQHMRNDPDVQVRLLATKRFEEYGASEDDEPLIYNTLLHDKDPRVRAAVPHVIERSCRKYEWAHDALMKARQDPNPAVREAVQKALKVIDEHRRAYGGSQR
ncbi:MAG: HEAT repeat domain-containing protein [Armatimonadia bacterium]